MHDAPGMPKTKSKTNDTPYIGSREACQILGVDKSTLSRWVAAGRLTPIMRGTSKNGAMFFNRADVDALLAA